MTEIWKDVFHGIYAVSNFGRVKRLLPGRGTRAGRILSRRLSTGGYPQVVLYNGGICKSYPVHKLVADKFIGPCPSEKEVNHKDGNKQNNLKSNLEYATKRQNVCHARDTGLWKPVRGEKHGMAKLTEQDVANIRRRYRKGLGVSLSEEYGVSSDAIYRIVKRKTWIWLE